jgi:FkbM family methyltransferase
MLAKGMTREIDWYPPSTLGERFKRWLVPPKWELARIVARELAQGEPELALVHRWTDPTRAALDIGANRGIWANVLARHVPHVYALEPNPKLFKILQAAAGPKVTCLPFGASDKDDTASLMVPKGAKGYSNQGASLNPARVNGQAFGALDVQTRRIDSLELPAIGFIKTDVEGHEVAALQGARRLIERDRPNLIVEIEARHTGRPVAEMVCEIAKLGNYQVFYLQGGDMVGFEQFDQDRLQPIAGPVKHLTYINNFIFL